ncbi:TPA: hypothetical protein NDS87_004936 [Enterobacter cloacae]|uniref:hypothetical protein n=1 Tax=Enterobacter cloacae complex TaxID=354276 RepID=UPI000FDC88C2|nr:hypothetical protein [Enterobacter cloacae]MCL8189630.1 hypothetical protein [Enterobacter cloacae]MCM8140944.1 hypothetical protein [Enterobacter cloacae]MDH1191979.1 hypothetical protein [Enterobacter cloacae]HAS1731887.1 hypothetical protein [Enterobacter cloacae]HAV2102719.1 hypothetical protein [Enterobacter cloacae]
MKLIDILVQELPKLGGWPEGAVECVRFVDEATIDFYDEHGNWPDDCSLTYGPIAKAICITPTEPCQRESVTLVEYEAAFAAGKTEWDGQGLPPVGCRIEANYGGEWVEATVAYTERPEAHGDAVAWKEALVFDCKTTRPFWADELRPIRSEADMKKQDAIFAIAELCRRSASNGHSAELIYDAIKSGKIVID